MSLTTGENTIEGIMSTAVPTCQPEATPSAVRAQLRGEAWDSTATIYVCEGAGEAKTLVGRLDSTDLLQSMDAPAVEVVMDPVRAVLQPDSNREEAVLMAIETDRTEIPVVTEIKEEAPCFSAGMNPTTGTLPTILNSAERAIYANERLLPILYDSLTLDSKTRNG